MAKRRRLNKNIMILLGLGAVLALGVGLYGAKIVLGGQSVEELIAEAEEREAAGKQRGAMASYMRAYQQSKQDPELLMRYVESVKQVDAVDVVEARQFLMRIYDFTRQATEIASGDLELLARFYEFVKNLGDDLQPVYFVQLIDLTNTVLESEPDNPVAQRYRGIAYIRNALLQPTPNLEPQVREQTLDDLEKSLARNPDDVEVLQALAFWKLLSAGDLLELEPERAKNLFREARQSMRDALAKDPDNPQYILWTAGVFSSRAYDTADAEEIRLEVRDLIEPLEQRWLENPPEATQDNVRLIQSMLGLLRYIDLTEVPLQGTARRTSAGTIRASKLLEAAIAKAPENLFYLEALGTLLKNQQRFEDALDIYERMEQVSLTGKPLDMVLSFQRQLQAQFMIADIKLQQARPLPKDSSERLTLHEEVDILIAEIETTSPGLGIVTKLKGMLRYDQGAYGEAVDLLDRASTAFEDRDPELLIYSALARKEMGAPNAAAERLEAILEEQPTLIPVRMELAKIYLEARQFGLVRDQVDIIRRLDPTYAPALQLLAGLAAREGDLDEAIRIYNLLDPKANPALVRPLAILYMQTNQLDKARVLVNERLAEVPSDMTAVQMAIRLYEDSATREKLLDDALEAGADENAVSMIREYITTGTVTEGMRTDNIRDPIRRTLRRAQNAFRSRDYDEALELVQSIIDEADANPQTIEDETYRDALNIQFTIALVQNDWVTAEAIVGQVTQLNLDLANGRFWRGRLFAAQNKIAAAITEYTAGLDIKRIAPDNWRILGDLHMAVQNHVQAIEAYQRSLAQRTNNMAAIRGLASAYDARGEHEQALLMLSEALQQDNSNQDLLRLYVTYEQSYGDAREALKMRYVIEKVDPNDFDNRRGIAMTLSKLDQPEDALDAINLVIQEEGLTWLNVFSKSEIQRESLKTDAALATVDYYLAQRGSNVSTMDYLLKARLLWEINRIEASLATYNQAIAIEDPELMQASRELGDRLFRVGQYGRSVRLYRSVLTGSPDDLNVKLRLTEALIRLEQTDEAEQLLTEIGLSNRKVPALLATIQRQNGELNKAYETLAEGIRLHSTDADLYLLRAKFRLDENNTESVILAQRDLETVQDLRPSDGESSLLLSQVHRTQGDTDRAVSTLRQLLSRQPRNTRARLILAELHEERNEGNLADKLYEDAQIDDPTNIEWPLYRAQLADRTNNVRRSIQQWSRVLEIQNEPTPQAVAGLVQGYIEANEIANALDAFVKYVDLANQHPYLSALRARVLYEAGNVEAGMNVFDKAVREATAFSQLDAITNVLAKTIGADETMAFMTEAQEAGKVPAVWNAVILGKFETTQRQFANARDRLLAVEAQLPQSDTRLLDMWDRMVAISLYETGAYEESAKVYKRVIERSPNDASALNNLAFVLTSYLDRPEEALPLAKRAAKLLPGHAETLDTLGVALAATGDNEAAIEALNRSIAIKPMAANQIHLARMLVGSDNHMRARDLATRALEMALLDKDDDLAQQARDVLAELETP